MKTGFLIALTAGLTLTGCAGYRVNESGALVPQSAVEPYTQWPAELRGRTVQITMENGATNVVNFAPDGTMTIEPNPGAPVVNGYWGLRGTDVCVNFAPRGEECWDYRPVITAAGQPVTLTSSRGQTLSIRLLNQTQEEAVDRP